MNRSIKFFLIIFVGLTGIAGAGGYECSTTQTAQVDKLPTVGSCIATFPAYQYVSQRVNLNSKVDRASLSWAYNLFTKPPQPFFQLSEVDLTTGKIIAQKNFKRAQPFESSFFIDEKGKVRGLWSDGGILADWKNEMLEEFELSPADSVYKQGYSLQTNRPYPRPSPLSPTSLAMHCQRLADKQSGICHFDGANGKIQKFVATPVYGLAHSPRGNFVAAIVRGATDGNHRVIVTNTISGEAALDVKMNSKYSTDEIYFSDDENYLTWIEDGLRVKSVALADGTVVWDGYPVNAEGYPYLNPYSMKAQVLPGAKCIVVGGYRGVTTYAFFDVKSRQPVAESTQFNYASSCSKPVHAWGTNAAGTYLYVHADVQCGAFSDAIKRIEIPQACRPDSPKLNSSK